MHYLIQKQSLETSWWWAYFPSFFYPSSTCWYIVNLGGNKNKNKTKKQKNKKTKNKNEWVLNKAELSFARSTRFHNSVSRRHRRDTTMAALLSSIVIVFLFCHSSKLITNIYEAYQIVTYGQLMFWPPWAELLSHITHFMLALNSCINIFVYVAKVFSIYTCRVIWLSSNVSMYLLVNWLKHFHLKMNFWLFWFVCVFIWWFRNSLIRALFLGMTCVNFLCF